MMAKTPSEIRLIARTHARTAIATLVGVMRQWNAPPASRVAAANSLLDRGFGKATQPIAGEADHPVQVEIVEIVRTIVDPARRHDDPKLTYDGAALALPAAQCDVAAAGEGRAGLVEP
jgi:hypothetical protein